MERSAKVPGVPYRRPQVRRHRGFMYLDDETVINSLSAMEAGKIDEVVAKINSAREGTFAAGGGVPILKASGERSSTSSLEEEIVRVRTRFSVFEIWYSLLKVEKAVGTFDSWSSDSLVDVEPGDTVELAGEVHMQPLQVAIRLYLWFAEQARQPNTLFTQPQRDHKEIKDTAAKMKAMLGSGERDPVFVDVRPIGDDGGPRVVMELDSKWAVEPLGRLSGRYSIVAQVEEIIQDGELYPAVRLTQDVPPTKMELDTLREAMDNFVEPAKGLGLEIEAGAAQVVGPAVALRPIAVFR